MQNSCTYIMFRIKPTLPCLAIKRFTNNNHNRKLNESISFILETKIAHLNNFFYTMQTLLVFSLPNIIINGFKNKQ